MKRAVEKGVRSLSFPSLSTGAYGYPLKEAADIALSTVKEFMEQNPSLEKVRFVLFGNDAYDAYCEALKRLS